jgi:vacuolar-type H+-ATPase subunit F/Vma7
MVFLSVNTKNYDEIYKNGKTRIEFLNDLIERSSNNKVFILYYMEGCGPCNATRPEWEKIKNALKNYEDNNNVAIVDIDQALASKVKDAKQQPNSFPTMRFITNKGKDSENYEDSDIKEKDRTIDSFVDWIKLNTKKQSGGKTFKKKGKNRKLKGGKWSLKYKRSINCKRPRGFSQKQHCKYGRKK